MIYNIIKKELLQNFRDKKSLFFMILFPILMIIILGTAFSSVFSSNTSVPETKVIYSVDKKIQVSNDFISFAKDMEKNINIKFTEAKDDSQAKEDISNGQYDCYIKIDSKDKIQLQFNNRRDFNAKLVETLVNTFVEKNNVIAQISVDNPAALPGITQNAGKVNPDYVNIKSVNDKPTPSAKDYYAITMFTMTILYGIGAGSMSIIAENIRGTMNRVKVTTVSGLQFMVAKVVGVVIVTSLQVFLVYLFSKYLVKANWGNHGLAIMLVSLTLIIMSTCVGAGIANLTSNPTVVSILLNIAVPIMVFLGGGYINLALFNSSILNAISNVSPLKWANQVIFSIIYNNDFSKVPIAVTVNLSVAAAFIIIPLLIRGRREA